jgi:hypothetical protein
MSDAQKRVPHGRRRLRRIDRELRRSDPELASMLSIFSRLNAGEMMPGWEQMRTPRVLDWHLPLWPIASLAFLVVFAAGGGRRVGRGPRRGRGLQRAAHRAGRRPRPGWRQRPGWREAVAVAPGLAGSAGRGSCQRRSNFSWPRTAASGE